MHQQRVCSSQNSESKNFQGFSSVSNLVLVLQIQTHSARLSMSFGDMNSCPHTCVASTWATGPAPLLPTTSYYILRLYVKLGYLFSSSALWFGNSQCRTSQLWYVWINSLYVYVHDVQCVGSIYLKNLSGSSLRFTYKFFQKPRMKKMTVALHTSSQK